MNHIAAPHDNVALAPRRHLSKTLSLLSSPAADGATLAQLLSSQLSLPSPALQLRDEQACHFVCFLQLRNEPVNVLRGVGNKNGIVIWRVVALAVAKASEYP